MMKIEVKGASCKVGFNKVLSGSVLKGTVNPQPATGRDYTQNPEDPPNCVGPTLCCIRASC